MDTTTKLTEEELVKYNGKKGRPAYFAYGGKVYDVSDSYFWKDGRHQVLHSAGKDLTAAMKQAPHGVDLLEKFPVVGTMRRTSSPKSSSDR